MFKQSWAETRKLENPDWYRKFAFETPGNEDSILNNYLVHASNPVNFESLVKKGFIFPNSMFKDEGITTLLAIPYPNENSNERFNDCYVHFSDPRSIVPETSINLHTDIEDYKYWTHNFDENIPLKIYSVRFYYNKEVLAQQSGFEITPENSSPYYLYRMKGLVDIYLGLEAILIPKELKIQIPDKLR
ncbi:MAG: hypothetical protein KKF95_03395, partial [Nanoarchaeota archaeon]|nr:hypothetical protein [Nanoarchaeota archaeon]